MRRSVISIEDGACVMQSGGLAFFTASCGVSPQAQNTGSSSSRHLRVADVLIAPGKIDADRRRVADMDRRAVHIGKARRDLDGADGVGRLEGAHGHHQRAAKRPGRHGVDVGHVDAGDARCARGTAGAGPLPAAPPRTRTSSRARRSRDRRARCALMSVTSSDEFAVAENVIARDVGADVEIVGQRRQARIADIRAREQADTASDCAGSRAGSPRAQSRGRMQTLACTRPGAMPAV